MLNLKFVDGLIPVIVQDSKSREVLMMGYANAEAIRLTQETGYAHYYSRSRKKLWKKGEESGHCMDFVCGTIHHPYYSRADNCNRFW